MKRFIKQSVAAALCAAMVITLMPGNDADAAKKVKISKKASVTVGQKKTIKVKNASKKAKVTWKVKKASIAKITGKVAKGKKASVTILGVSAGKTKLTGTYKLGKKKTKLTCTVTVTPGAVNPTTTQPAGQVTVQPTQSVVQPTSPVVVTDQPNATEEPTAKPTRTPRVTSAPTPVPTPKYQKPDVTADPVVNIPLAEGSFYNEGTEDNAAITYNEDGTMTIVFKTQWAAVNFVLPDNAQNYYSEYKSAVLTYKSEGTFAQNEEGNANGLGHALFDADWDPSGTDMAAGKHPDWGKKIAQSDEYTTKVFNVTSECVGDCIRGLQIFNPNEMGEGDSITITIKSMIFYNEEKADDFVPEEPTTPPSENPSVNTYEVDLTDSAAYTLEGATSASYNSETGTLDVVVPQFNAIIFKAPAEGAYKYVEIAYTSDSKLNYYVFDSDLTDGLGQTPAGQHEITEGLAAAEETAVVGNESDEGYAGDCVTAIKIVHVDWNSSAAKNIKIESIKFMTEKPGV